MQLDTAPELIAAIARLTLDEQDRLIEDIARRHGGAVTGKDRESVREGALVVIELARAAERARKEAAEAAHRALAEEISASVMRALEDDSRRERLLEAIAGNYGQFTSQRATNEDSGSARVDVADETVQLADEKGQKTAKKTEKWRTKE